MNPHSHKISIIVPVYNAEKTIGRCIKSILSQSYANIELILINDGSIDNSENICKHFASIDKRIRYFFQQNSGVSLARNLGLKESKGSFIMFVDSDDYIGKNYLSSFVDSLNDFDKHKINFVVGGYRIIKGHDIIYKYEQPCGILSSDTSYRIFTDFHIEQNAVVWGKLFSSQIIKRKKMMFAEGIHSGEDTLFLLEYLLFMEGNIKIIDNSEYYYTSSDSGVTLSNYKGDFDGKKKVTNLIINATRLLSHQMEYPYEANKILFEIPIAAFDKAIEAYFNEVNNDTDYTIKKLYELDWSFYWSNKEYGSWKEKVFRWPLKMKCPKLFRIIRHLRFNI